MTAVKRGRGKKNLVNESRHSGSVTKSVGAVCFSCNSERLCVPAAGSENVESNKPFFDFLTFYQHCLLKMSVPLFTDHTDTLT